MIIRLVAVVVVSIVLGGYVPRGWTTGQHAWIVWLASACFVFGAPRLLRLGIRRAWSSRR